MNDIYNTYIIMVLDKHDAELTTNINYDECHVKMLRDTHDT